MERVVIESATDEAAIRANRGGYVTTFTRAEFAALTGWDVEPGAIAPIEIRDLRDGAASR